MRSALDELLPLLYPTEPDRGLLRLGLGGVPTLFPPVIPEAARPIPHGYESIDWSDCALAHRYDIPGRDSHIPWRIKHVD